MLSYATLPPHAPEPAPKPIDPEQSSQFPRPLFSYLYASACGTLVENSTAFPDETETLTPRPLCAGCRDWRPRRREKTLGQVPPEPKSARARRREVAYQGARSQRQVRVDRLLGH